MTRVDFYILATAEPQERLLFACRLTEKAFRIGHQVYLHTASAAQATELNELLWSYRAESFIPHNILNDGSAPPARVEIGHQDDPIAHADVLVNLADNIPTFFSRFTRVAEVVIQQPEVLASTRDSFGFYRDRGYPMQTHDLRKS